MRTDPEFAGLGGPAVLFENVEGSEFPVLINAFGSYSRMELALGRGQTPRTFVEGGRVIGELVKPEPPRGIREAIAKAREMAGIEADEKTRLVFYPVANSGIPGFGPAAEASAEDLQTLAGVAELLRDERVQALIEQGGVFSQSPVQARGPLMIEK